MPLSSGDFRTAAMSAAVAVDRFRRERRRAYGDVLGAARFGTTVSHPLPHACDHGLPRTHIKHAAFVLNSYHSLQHYRDLLELGPLARLAPALRRDHAGHADRSVARVHAAGEFFDLFRLVTR